MAEQPIVALAKKEPKLPVVVEHKKRKTRLAFHVEGTPADFKDGKAKVVFDNIVKLFAPNLTANKINKLIPIKIEFCHLKHNLPISIVPNADLGTPSITGTDHEGKFVEYQAVVPPNSQIEHYQILRYEEKFNESLLRSADTINEEMLKKQIVELPSEKMKNYCLITPWLNEAIIENKRLLETVTGHRVGQTPMFALDETTTTYPMDKAIAHKVIQMLTDQLKTIPYKSVGPSLKIEFSPYGYESWADLYSKWQVGSSTAHEAFLNMPFYIAGTIKYVYAVLD